MRPSSSSLAIAKARISRSVNSEKLRMAGNVPGEAIPSSAKRNDENKPEIPDPVLGRGDYSRGRRIRRPWSEGTGGLGLAGNEQPRIRRRAHHVAGIGQTVAAAPRRQRGLEAIRCRARGRSGKCGDDSNLPDLLSEVAAPGRDQGRVWRPLLVARPRRRLTCVSTIPTSSPRHSRWAAKCRATRRMPGMR